MNWILNPLPLLSIIGNLSCSDFGCPGTFACANNICESGYFKSCGTSPNHSEKGYFNCGTLAPCNMEYFCRIGLQIYG